MGTSFRLMPVLFAGLLLLNSTACMVENNVSNGPIQVELRQTDGRYQLYRGGEPYYIKGGGGTSKIAQLAAHGGNSLRTWSTRNAQAVLDSAHAAGLTVTLGLDVARERHGFDYNDSVAVAQQLETLRQEVLKYKDHPALIIWAIGNELNLNATNARVWDAINDISKMIHEVDPAHLTTTTLAGANPDVVREIKNRAPDLDLFSFQLYADLVNLPRYLKEMEFEGPYMVTEWGATGHWEVQKTPWDAPIENTSSVKADGYLNRYQSVIASDATRCVGSYVFLWEQKQERTPTWYGVFLESGEETEAVDVMHYLWTGAWPENRTPRLESARLNGKTAYDGVYLEPGKTYPVETVVNDPDGDPVTYHWDLKPESTDLGEGGDFETTPESIPGRIDPTDGSQVTLTAPDQPGAYRLFVYAFDGQGHAAHANIPFFVQ